MATDKQAFIQQYKVNSRKKCFALRDWLILNRKDETIGLNAALEYIYDVAQGRSTVMDDIIARLTDKKKVYGRANAAYGSPRQVSNGIDLRRLPDGSLELVGYSPNVPLTAKGQKVDRNPNIFKQDGTTKKTYQNMEKRMYDIGAAVRRLNPTANVAFIAEMITAIRAFAAQHKINADRVVAMLEKGRLKYDRNKGIVPASQNESVENMLPRTILITEEAARMLADEMKMTEYRFNSNLRLFLRDLLTDPVHTQIPDTLAKRGYSKSRFIQILMNNKILVKDERISDKDENGEPKTATMMVKYRVPKADLSRKIKKLYIKLFEKNIPSKIDEDGEGGCASMGATSADASGQFLQPVFPMQRRKLPNITSEATTTTTASDYQYTVPFPGDDETLARHNGEGGSVSINKMENA